MAHWRTTSYHECNNQTQAFIRQTCAALNCVHFDDVSYRDYTGSNRAHKISCSICGYGVFVKSFCNDQIEGASDSGASERALRMKTEISNIEYLTSNGYCSDEFRPPNLKAFIGAPYFALIEEDIRYDLLLSHIEAACISTEHNAERLISNLDYLAFHLARFHDRNCTSDNCHNLDFRHKFEVGAPLHRLATLNKFSDLLPHLRHSLNRWSNSAKFALATSHRTVIHGGLSAVNIAVSDDQKIRLLDLETLHVNTPLIDIGNITAEIKLQFYVHKRLRHEASEEFISFFLQRYFFYCNWISFSYKEFTFAHAFFMGLQLINTAASNYLDENIRHWCISIGQSIWELIDRESDWFLPPYTNKRGVFFDFYNTLVEITDDEHRIENFTAVTKFIHEVFGSPWDVIPDPTALHDMYFKEIEVAYHTSAMRTEHPDVDLEKVWEVILKRENTVSPTLLDSDEGKEKLRNCLLLFRQTAIVEFRPDPNAHIVLRKLLDAGIRIGIISDAQPAYFEAELEESGLGHLLSERFLSVTYGIRKPSKEFFQKALVALNESPKDVVFVGDDMFRDIGGARQAGMSTIFKPSEHGNSYCRGCCPDNVIKDLAEILPLFGIS